MNIVSCEHPVRIWDKAKKCYTFVPCGKCNVCRNRRTADWVSRIERESQCWKYTFFVTLTYDEKNVPLMIYDKQNYCLTDVSSGQVVPITKSWSNGTKKYMNRVKRVRVLCHQDVQKFIKRLRYYNSCLNEKKEYKILRYYAIGEYGSTTKRPHYHVIFWSNSECTAKNFAEMLSKSWKLGITDWSFVRSSAASYVASYVNSFYNLPEVLQEPAIRPFSLCSRFPVIGSLPVLDEKIEDVFHNGIVRLPSFDAKRNTFVYVPLLKSDQNKLFPKVQGFNRISHIDRVALYGITSIFNSESYAEFFEDIGSSLDYFHKNRLPFTPWFCIVHDCWQNENSLYNLYCTSRRVLTQCVQFGCSLDYYVTRIENYYNNCDYENLKAQLRFEQNLVDCQGAKVTDLLALFPDFLDNLRKSLSTTHLYLDDFNYLLEGFGLDISLFVNGFMSPDDFDLKNNRFVKSYLKKHSDLSRKLVKTKFKNDYLNAHPEQKILIF